MKTREKRDEMILTLALLEQLEKDEELKEFEKYETRKGAAEPDKEIHEFSKRHKEKMEELFKMASQEENRKKRRRRFRRTAAGLAACLGVTICMGFTSSAFRRPVLNFFTEVRETYSELLVDKGEKNSVTKNFQEYEPDYVVEGFYVDVVEEKHDYFIIFYVSDDGGWYDFYYYKEPYDSQVDTEELAQAEVEINGREGVLYQKAGYNQTVVRSTAGQFGVVGNISAEEEKQILESVKIQKLELKNKNFY